MRKKITKTTKHACSSPISMSPPQKMPEIIAKAAVLALTLVNATTNEIVSVGAMVIEFPSD
jgi:hypothetical protein